MKNFDQQFWEQQEIEAMQSEIPYIAPVEQISHSGIVNGVQEAVADALGYELDEVLSSFQLSDLGMQARQIPVVLAHLGRAFQNEFSTSGTVVSAESVSLEGSLKDIASRLMSLFQSQGKRALQTVD